MKAGEILRRLVRDPRFWAVAVGGLVVSMVVRLLVSGTAGEMISNALFLGAAFAAGSMARSTGGG